jgi:isopenicillin N synthase-like dioxygenase
LVRFSDSLQKEIRVVADSLGPFFALPEEEKRKFNQSELLGYNSVRGINADNSDGPVFKEKLTYVTGSRLSRVATRELECFIRKADTLTEQLCSAASGMNLPKVEKEIPLLQGDGAAYALFDVARYVNSTLDGVPKGANVASHYDPGLLAVSWFSDQKGLQVFQTSSNSFIDVPLDLGVVWAGDAGHHLLHWNRGIHRGKKKWKVAIFV